MPNILILCVVYLLSLSLSLSLSTYRREEPLSQSVECYTELNSNSSASLIKAET